MTDTQKELITHMRKDSLSYSEIADTLGVSRNTVKSFCLRNKPMVQKLKPSALAKSVELYCKQCGKKLKQTPGRKPRKFCSDTCRVAWWNIHPESVNRKANYTLLCVGCGKPFISYGNKERRYCSHACYISDRFKKEHNI